MNCKEINIDHVDHNFTVGKSTIYGTSCLIDPIDYIIYDITMSMFFNDTTHIILAEYPVSLAKAETIFFNIMSDNFGVNKNEIVKTKQSDFLSLKYGKSELVIQLINFQSKNIPTPLSTIIDSFSVVNLAPSIVLNNFELFEQLTNKLNIFTHDFDDSLWYKSTELKINSLIICNDNVNSNRILNNKTPPNSINLEDLENAYFKRK